MTVQPPVADIRPITRTHHGRSFVDNYEWMREKTAPETIEYLNAENAYTEQETAHLAPLREAIFSEISSRIKQTDMSVPSRTEKYWYFGRTEECKSYGRSCRIPVEDDSWTPPEIHPDSPHPREEVVLDMDALAEGHEFFSLGAMVATRSGRYVAYSTDTSGDERFELVIKDLSTGELLPDRIADTFYGALFSEDERYIFYTRVDEAWRPDSVWRHEIGTDAAADVRIFHEPDEKFWVSIGKTRSNKYLVIDDSSKLTSEQWVCPMSDPTGDFECVMPRTSGVEYGVDHAVVGGEDRWLVLHNATGPNFALGWARVGELNTVEDLHELLPHREDVRLEGVDCFAEQLILSYRSAGLARLAIMALDGADFGSFAPIEFDEELYSAGFGSNALWHAPVLRMGYSSYTTPTQVLDYVVATGERIVRKEQEVLGGYERDDYTATREWATASDGSRIPISLIRRADLDLSQPHPTMLYGYGSYEMSNEPGFSVSALSLMDRGMVIAIAHIRGGGEMGRAWYDEGKMLKKMNTFTDFIACADYLLDSGMTTSQQLVAQGGSAGGLLMGAVANLAPEKFAAIQAIVPFVDPLTSILMPELPLTVTEWEEWGDPLHDAKVYDYIATYAPYENVCAQNYPNIMAITSLNDTRVLYVEPAKWIAKLRATATGGQFLLKTEMVAGHGGVSGRYDKWKQTAFEYAWVLDQAGAA
ncbi:S9 family peptidase [Corynebacterium sp. TAE3-ERU2]|uniref:S9 family peptidase n=1 Tax=Corynebacterium sp. TAE3-ERU2 TaxID=2849497 RepID=UPI001C48C462|nr:S9 family peptidase [Corynebacterium sp. TAE3-ERU2]MBV7301552.1 S9 family peptidase [Corynebacterium sp. TAE3-ERU2]